MCSTLTGFVITSTSPEAVNKHTIVPISRKLLGDWGLLASRREIGSVSRM